MNIISVEDFGTINRTTEPDGPLLRRSKHGFQTSPPRPLEVLVFSDENKMEYFTPGNVSAAAIHCHSVFLSQF